MWIKERIDAEFRKHYSITSGLDWSRIAEGKIKSQIKLEFSHAYNKCNKGLKEIKNQKQRENNTLRDWEQRMDEILLIYSSIFNISVNEARKELLLSEGERT
ncbi:hypothetical protein LCGC14_1402540 [marine sediment metagenome]|uniref:Uncharacterized protein n=1 Tax=marine sediment metagenome TaxID=412755 RepID=A0A0F9MY59_9ZZZZ